MGLNEATGEDTLVMTRLRKVLRNELRRAQRILVSVKGRAEQVHEVRQSIKRLRAGLRLAGKIFDKDDLIRVEIPLRAAAQVIGPLRDDEVLRETMGRLRNRKEAVPELTTISSTIPLRTARSELKKAAVAIGGLSWTGVSPDGWRDGLKKLYRRGREAMRQAKSGGSDQDLHTWRKRTKDFYYALGLLDGPMIPGEKSTGKLTKLLAEALGDDHDLAFLEQKFSSSGKKKEFRSMLRRSKKRRAKLQKRAFRLGARIFKRSARKFESRLDKGVQRDLP